MAEQYIKKIRTDAGDLQIDYTALANLPDLSVYATKKSVDDAKALITKVENEMSTLDDAAVKSIANIQPDSNGNVVITPENIGALNTNKIANNLTTTDSGYVLDARQGVAVDTRLKVFENAMTVSSNSVDLKGKYLDNALFR